MEQALRDREEDATKEKESVQQLVQALQEAQKTPNKFKGIHAGYYTPAEYRVLSDEEKELVKTLREAGLASTSEDAVTLDDLPQK